MIKKLKLLTIFLIVFACNPKQSNQKDTLFKSLNESQTGIDFTNKIVDTKALNIFSYRNFYNGAGVGIGDINNETGASNPVVITCIETSILNPQLLNLFIMPRLSSASV